MTKYIIYPIYRLVVGAVSIVDVKYRHMSCILANITRAGEKESFWNLSLCMDDLLAWTNVSYQMLCYILHWSLSRESISLCRWNMVFHLLCFVGIVGHLYCYDVRHTESIFCFCFVGGLPYTEESLSTNG